MALCVRGRMLGAERMIESFSDGAYEGCEYIKGWSEMDASEGTGAFFLFLNDGKGTLIVAFRVALIRLNAGGRLGCLCWYELRSLYRLVLSSMSNGTNTQTMWLSADHLHSRSKPAPSH